MLTMLFARKIKCNFKLDMGIHKRYLGLVPDHCNKTNIIIKQVNNFFANKSYVWREGVTQVPAQQA
jgi:hypothetical protein